MAVTMQSNLQAIVQNTLTDSIRMIDISELHESAENFFTVDRIEEFADTILGQGGVKDNLVVRPLESGGYEIISGHRRKAAVQHLLDRGETISRYLPCLVQQYPDEDARMLDLVLMNVSARSLSDPELWESFETLERIFKAKKQAGEKFGRTRERLAKLLGVSPAQIGKMQNVERNAVPSVVAAVKDGALSISAANEIAKFDASEQNQQLRYTSKNKRNSRKVATNSNTDDVLLQFVREHSAQLCDVLAEIIGRTENAETIALLRTLQTMLVQEGEKR